MTAPVVGLAAAAASLSDVIAARIDQFLGGEARTLQRPSVATVVVRALIQFAITVIMLVPTVVGAGLHLHVLSEGGAAICPL